MLAWHPPFIDLGDRPLRRMNALNFNARGQVVIALLRLNDDPRELDTQRTTPSASAAVPRVCFSAPTDSASGWKGWMYAWVYWNYLL